jgi:uncharacterized membrane protein
MHRRLPLLFRAIVYALRGGFLIRPFVIALVLGAAGGVLSSLEEQVPTLSAWVPTTLFPSRQDPQVAQVILSAIATSIMTVVSIVFAILLMTLTLASTQFSPRILVSFVRDRGTQWTLGVFLGTFSYCMAALPAARSLPVAFVPVLTVTGAMVLALVAVGWLIFFIHHISQAISVNHIVDRIARETELVIDELMPRPRTRFVAMSRVPMDDTSQTEILNQHSGYVRFVDVDQLLYLAKSWRIRIRVERGVGQFVPAGVPLLHVSREDRINPVRTAELLGAFDIGPARTLQQDVVRRHPDRRYRAASDLPGGERSQHRVQLPRPAQPRPNPLARPRAASVGGVRSAACSTGVRALDQRRRHVRHRFRTDRPLRGERCRCQPAVAAGDRRYCRHGAA